jgi:hypothetical protein
MRNRPRRNWVRFEIERLSTFTVAEQSMKFIISLVAVGWLVSGCAALAGAPDDDSIMGATLDMRTGVCTDATPLPCEPPRD